MHVDWYVKLCANIRNYFIRSTKYFNFFACVHSSNNGRCAMKTKTETFEVYTFKNELDFEMFILCNLQ